MGKPLIGITTEIREDMRMVFVRPEYLNSILEAGGIPVMLPLTCSEEDLREVFDHVDGLLLPGGGDMDPLYFNENILPCNGEISPLRDRTEFLLARMAISEKKPVLGICRGCQVLNVAGGGTLYQDITVQIEERILLQHSQKAPRWYGTHDVNIKEYTMLYDIMERTALRTNSFHHQAIKEPGQDFIVSAYTADGIIECIEHRDHPFCIGIQWHPECMWEKDRIFLKPFERLVEMCI